MSSKTGRCLCDECGTPIADEADWFPGETHFYAAGLDKPRGVEPEGHAYCAEMFPWVKLADDLPRYAHSGSGNTEAMQDE